MSWLIAAVALLAACEEGSFDPAALGRSRLRPAPPNLAALAATCSPTTSFRGDYETGTFAQWDGGVDARSYPGAARQFSHALVVRSPVRQGTYAAAFNVRSSVTYPDSSERAEANKCIGDTQGTDAYYAFATYFPGNYSSPSWATVYQWEAGNLAGIGADCVQNNISATPNTSSPGTFMLQMRSRGGLIVDSISCPPDHYPPILSRLTIGQWNDFVVHFKWSTDTTGRIDIWWRLEGGTFQRILNPGPGPDHLDSLLNHVGDTTFHVGPNLLRKWDGTVAIVAITEGVYRQANTTWATVYHDSYVRGTSMAEDTLAAFPARVPPIYLCATDVIVGGGPNTAYSGRGVIVDGGNGAGCQVQLVLGNLTIG